MFYRRERFKTVPYGINTVPHIIIYVDNLYNSMKMIGHDYICIQ